MRSNGLNPGPSALTQKPEKPQNPPGGHPKNTTGNPFPAARERPAERGWKNSSAQKNCRPLAGAAAIESSSAGSSQNRLPADGLRQRQTRRPAISGAASWYSRYASLNHLLWLRGIPAVAVPARTPPPGGFLPSRHWGTVGRRRPNRCFPGPASPAERKSRQVATGRPDLFSPTGDEPRCRR